MPNDPTPEDGAPWVAANRDALIDEMRRMSDAVKRKIDALAEKKDAISISDMFEMQMMMNKLSQLSEMSTGIVSATNTAIASMARNVKS